MLFFSSRLKHEYEEYHNVKYSDEILNFIVNISKIITTKKNPDKVIDILDETGLIANRCHHQEVTEEIITNLVYEAIGINRINALEILNSVDGSENLKPFIYDYLNLKSDKVIARVETLNKDNELDFLKTIFNTKPDAILEIDLQDFIDNAFATNLIGAPSGYVGYENGGILTEHLIANPFSIIVLKNFDNANIIVKGIINRAIESGFITDNKRRTISLRNTIFIIEKQSKTKKIGFIQNKA